MTQLDWNLARAFSATAEAGSLSAAARKLGLTQPTLSRQIAALEVQLGAMLFDRVGKKLALTVTGLGLLEHARAMAAAADAMALAAVGRAQDISGPVSISASDAFAAYLLTELVERIRREAPQIAIVIIASNALSDLRRREADIAIRHVRPSEPELIAKLVGEMEAHLYAAQSWVEKHGMPRTPADIDASQIMGIDPVERFSDHMNGAGFAIRPDQFRIVSENSVVLWEMVKRGLGCGMMLEPITARTPGVVRLLPDMPPALAPVWLVTHRELHTSRRIRLVYDTLAEELGRIVRKPENA